MTTAHVSPGSHRLLTGQGGVVKLGGPAADRVLLAQADLSINFGSSVFNPPDDMTYPFPASADVEIACSDQENVHGQFGCPQSLLRPSQISGAVG